MPKITSRYINNQMRTYDENLEKLSGEIIPIEEENLEKTRKVDMPRIWNGYLCKHNRKVMLYEEASIKEEQEKSLPEIATKNSTNTKVKTVLAAHTKIFANTNLSAKKSNLIHLIQ